MTTHECSIAIIGAGGIANAHIQAAEDNGFPIVAVVDPSEEAVSRAAAKTGAKAYASTEAMLTDGVQPKLAVVCTPPSARDDAVRRLLGAGVGILAEKPLAHTPDEAAKLLEIARSHADVLTAVGYCHRFAPAIMKMRSLVTNGAIGDLVRFENVFACTIPGMESRWMSDPAISGGGSLIDTGSHSLDLFRYLVGPAKVESVVPYKPWAGRGEAAATVLVSERESGIAGVVLSGWAEPARFVVSLVGTDAILSYDYEKPTELTRLNADGTSHVIEVETHEIRFARQLAAAAACTRGQPRGELASFEDGLAVAEDVGQALASAG
ncbi:MAG: Gfo/Idh/MocA family oxidoreductase [Planctomycetota bacterium]